MHTHLNTPLISFVFACRAALTVALVLKRGAVRMPGVMPSLG